MAFAIRRQRYILHYYSFFPFPSAPTSKHCRSLELSLLFTLKKAVLPLLDRLSSGLTHLLVSASLSKTPYAALSRPVTGIRKKSIILTVPGSPKGARENVEAVLKILPHAVDLACGGSGASVHNAMQGEKSGESEKGETREHGHDCVHHQSHGHGQQHAGEKKLLSNPSDAPGMS